MNRQVARKRQRSFALAAGLLAFGAALMVVAALRAVDRRRGPLFGEGAVAVAAGAIALVLAARNSRTHPIVDFMDRRAGDIAWIYVDVAVTGAGVRRKIRVYATDGASVVADAPADETALLEELYRRAPEAERGYSKELDARYRRRRR